MLFSQPIDQALHLLPLQLPEQHSQLALQVALRTRQVPDGGTQMRGVAVPQFPEAQPAFVVQGWQLAARAAVQIPLWQLLELHWLLAVQLAPFACGQPVPEQMPLQQFPEIH